MSALVSVLCSAQQMLNLTSSAFFPQLARVLGPAQLQGAALYSTASLLTCSRVCTCQRHQQCVIAQQGSAEDVHEQQQQQLLPQRRQQQQHLQQPLLQHLQLSLQTCRCFMLSAHQEQLVASAMCRTSTQYRQSVASPPAGYISTAGFATVTSAVGAGDAADPGHKVQAKHENSRQSEIQNSSRATTRLIKSCDSLQQLAQVVLQHGRTFNAINTSAAFGRAAMLLSRHHQPDLPLPPAAPAAAEGEASVAPLVLGTLTTLWKQQLTLSTPWELVGVMLACSKLGYLDAELWSNTLAALVQQQDKLNMQDAGSAAYAMAAAAAANQGAVPGLTKQEAAEVLHVLTCRLLLLVAGSIDGHSNSSSSGGSGGNSSSGARKQRAGVAAPAAKCAQSISSILWAHAKLGIQLQSAQQLSGLLKAFLQTQLQAAANPQAVVNTLWAVSELQQLPGWHKVATGAAPSAELASQAASRAAAAAAAVTAAATDVAVAKGLPATQYAPKATAAAATGAVSEEQQQLQLQLTSLLSQEQLECIAAGSPQAVSNTLLAISRLAAEQHPHLLDVPFAQQCMRQLLLGPTAQNLAGWNAQDVGNAVWAAAQVGVSEPNFLHAVAASMPGWLADAGAASLIQVASGCARLKFKQSDFIDSLVKHGKLLLHKQQHHQHHRHADSNTTADDTSSSDSSPSSTSSNTHSSSNTSSRQLPQQGTAEQQHVAERTAAVLCWAIATLGQTQLAREVPELLRASEIKQQTCALHPTNARLLWVVHAWLLKHKLTGGHGLERLLTEKQLAECAVASRHTHRVTPPAPAAHGHMG